MNTNRFSIQTRIRCWLPLLCAAAVVVLGIRPARADLIFSVSSTTANSPSSGNILEVDLTNNGGAAVDISAFGFGIETNPLTADIQFTSATTATTNHSYIFADGSSFGPTISSQTGTELIAGDLSSNSQGFVSVGAGDTVGLGEVFFSVAAGTGPGVIAVSFDTSASSLSDPSGAPITIDSFDDGTITINGSGAAVPEPSTLTLLAVGLLGLSGYSWRRRRSA